MKANKEKIQLKKKVKFCGEHYLSSIIIGFGIPVVILIVVSLIVIFS